ncbi:MAG: SCO family protein [Thermodesulfobacteriota bacterium]
MKRKKILIASVTVLSLVLVIWAVIIYQIFSIKSKESFYGSSYDMRAPDFTLTDQDGEKVSLGQFKGKAVFMFFGYTHCPDICPVTLSTLNNVVNELGEDGDKVQVLFVTVDPERDTQAEIKKYVTFFNKDFIGLTGTPEEIKNVSDSYHAFYMKEETGSDSGYLMGHTSSIYLIDPEGRIVLRYPQSKMDPKEIAKDVERIL